MASCDIHTHARRVMLVLALAITLAGVPRVYAPRPTSTPSRTTTGAITVSLPSTRFDSASLVTLVMAPLTSTAGF